MLLHAASVTIKITVTFVFKQKMFSVMSWSSFIQIVWFIYILLKIKRKKQIKFLKMDWIFN